MTGLLQQIGDLIHDQLIEENARLRAEAPPEVDCPWQYHCPCPWCLGGYPETVEWARRGYTLESFERMLKDMNGLVEPTREAKQA